ncbi:MAG: flippase [Clostridia bacterium]|nr:flippase [Clostridia bacterium]
MDQPLIKEKKRSLKYNFIFSLISQILNLITPLITAPYLARVLHEVGTGQYSYSISIVTYFMLFANLGFDIYGQRQIAGCLEDEEAKSKVFWEIFILKSGLSMVSLAVLFGVLFTVGFGENYDSIIFVLAFQILSVPIDIQFLFRGEERFASLAFRTVVIKLLMIAGIFLFVKQESDVIKYAICVTVVTIFSVLILWFSLSKSIKIVSIKKLKIFRHFIPALLIFLPTVATSIYTIFDKTMIGLLASNPDYENGCYEQAYRINSFALILITVMTSIMISRNSRDFSKGEMDKVKSHLYFASNYIWFIGIPLIVGFCVLSGNLSSWFLGEGYDKVPLLLQIMSARFILTGFSDMISAQLFIAIKKEKFTTIASLIVAILNVVLNYFLIPKFGSVGAAIATTMTEFLLTFILVCFVIKNKYFSVKYVFKMSWKYIVASGIMFVPIYFMQRNMDYGILSFIAITITGFIVYAITLMILRDSFFFNIVKSILIGLKKRIAKNR